MIRFGDVSRIRGSYFRGNPDVCGFSGSRSSTATVLCVAGRDQPSGASCPEVGEFRSQRNSVLRSRASAHPPHTICTPHPEGNRIVRGAGTCGGSEPPIATQVRLSVARLHLSPSAVRDFVVPSVGREFQLDRSCARLNAPRSELFARPGHTNRRNIATEIARVTPPSRRPPSHQLEHVTFMFA